MEKYEKQAKLYLVFTFLIGILIGFYDSREFNIIYLAVFGIGMVSISIVIGILLESVISTFLQKLSKNIIEETILDDLENENKIKLEKAREKVLSYRNRFKYGFLFALSIILYEFINVLI